MTAFNRHALIYDEHDPAVAALELALKADPEDERSQLFLGIMPEQLGRPEEAARTAKITIS